MDFALIVSMKLFSTPRDGETGLLDILGVR
jgi:hypothetical protein